MRIRNRGDPFFARLLSGLLTLGIAWPSSACASPQPRREALRPTIENEVEAGLEEALGRAAVPMAGLEEGLGDLAVSHPFDGAATAQDALEMYQQFERDILIPKLKTTLSPEVLDHFYREMPTTFDVGLTEAVINLIEHGGGGRFELYLYPAGGPPHSRMTIRLLDAGPGVRDPERALQESVDRHDGTRGDWRDEGRGLGWRNVALSADRMTLESLGQRWELVNEASPGLHFERIGESPVSNGTVLTLTIESPFGSSTAGLEEPSEDSARPQRLVFNIQPGWRNAVEMTLPTGTEVFFRVRNGRVEVAPAPSQSRKFVTHRRRSLQPGAVFGYTLYKTGKILQAIRAGESGRWRPVEEGVYFFPLELAERLLAEETDSETSPERWREAAPYVFDDLGRDARGVHRVRLSYRESPVVDLSAEEPPAGLEEAISAAEGLRAVVIGRSVAERFPALAGLARLKGRFLVDEGVDTVVRLAGWDVSSVAYYGGLEEAGVFAALAGEALVAVERHPPTGQTFLAGLEEILRLAGIPENVVAAGLEGFAAELESLAVGA